jgi:hypothetical protein
VRVEWFNAGWIIQRMRKRAGVRGCDARVAAGSGRNANAPVNAGRTPFTVWASRCMHTASSSRTMEDDMATKKSKASSGKKLKKVPLKPVKNLTTTQSFLKIDGIKGESVDTNHQDWIE